MRIDEAGHHDATLRIDLDRIRSALQILPAISPPRRHNDAVARRHPSAIDRADIARCRSDTRTLFFQRRQCEQSSAPNDEIRFGH
jgi:hypothetical protein